MLQQGTVCGKGHCFQVASCGAFAQDALNKRTIAEGASTDMILRVMNLLDSCISAVDLGSYDQGAAIELDATPSGTAAAKPAEDLETPKPLS